MTNIKFYIITRFNLPLYKSNPDFNKDKLGNIVNTETWLSNRFQLFETYCLPSVINQTNKNFTWLCLFDENTSEKWKSNIADYSKVCPNFKACYLSLEETDNLIDYLSNTIIDDISGSDVSHVATIRLDNDDSINVQMLDELTTRLSNSPVPGFYSFRYGVQYFTNDKSIKGYYFPNNHFLVRLEKRNNHFDTAMDCNHTQVKIYKIYKNKKPMWAEIVHDNNVVNEVIFNKNMLLLIEEILCSTRYKNLKLFGLDNIRISRISFLLSFKLLFQFALTKTCRKIKRLYKHS